MYFGVGPGQCCCRVDWLRESQSAISCCNQVDLVEGFAFGVLGKQVSASWVGSGQWCFQVELRVIGSVGYGCLSLSLLFRVVIKWIWWRALGLGLDCWINESWVGWGWNRGHWVGSVNRIGVQNKMGLKKRKINLKSLWTLVHFLCEHGSSCFSFLY